jgi:L-lysine 2,3-aminomutase
LKPTVVLHSNHPQELDESVARAAARLRSVPGRILLNQSVLLRGVNDSSELLAALSWRLLDLGIIPYYLHQLDRVHGASHFEVPISRGREIARELEALLPGYAVPQYVQEIPGSPGKTRLT